MSDATGEGAEAFHFLRLDQLLFEALALGVVKDITLHLGEPAQLNQRLDGLGHKRRVDDLGRLRIRVEPGEQRFSRRRPRPRSPIPR